MKNYTTWFIYKKKIEIERRRILLKRGEIWICCVGENIGYEIDGKDAYRTRPVFILSAFGKSGAVVLPLTTKNNHKNFLYEITNNSYVNLTQIRFLDSKRFLRKIDCLNKNQTEVIKRKLFTLLK